MAGQQWEYCQLSLVDSKIKSGLFATKPELCGYNCSIRYYCSNGDSVHSQLSELDHFLPFNPFVKAMALLGAAGWELVSIQHGIDTTITAGWIRWDNRVAYFKRPSIPGRPVTDPKLSI